MMTSRALASHSGNNHHLSELRIVLLGYRNSGKSSAGNTILGKEEFDTLGRTAQCVKRQGEVAGRQLTVVEAPGWWKNLTIDSTPELNKQEIVLSVSLCPPGPQTLLLLIRLNWSFTETYRRTVEDHLDLLSERVWSHTIVLFTCGDCLGDTTIEQHIESEGKALQWLVEKCGNRYHVLNNENRGDGTQVTELLEKIEEMVAGNNGCHYEIDSKSLQEVEERRRAEEGKAEERMMKALGQKEKLRSLLGDTHHLSELRIVLLGYKTVGKSSAGNTILGRNKFDLKITAQCVMRQREVSGRQLIVVDTPGWWLNSPLRDTTELVKQEIVLSVSLCPPGPQTLLLLIRVDTSFTETYRRTVEDHLDLLRERVWSHTIVLFTCGDCLGDTTIEQHIESEGKALQWLVEKCGNRYHVLNNENRGDGTQVTELLEKIEEMVAGNNGCHYDIDRKSLQEVEERRRAEERKAEERMMKVQKQMEKLESAPVDFTVDTEEEEMDRRLKEMKMWEQSEEHMEHLKKAGSMEFPGTHTSGEDRSGASVRSSAYGSQVALPGPAASPAHAARRLRALSTGSGIGSLRSIAEPRRSTGSRGIQLPKFFRSRPDLNAESESQKNPQHKLTEDRQKAEIQGKEK